MKKIKLVICLFAIAGITSCGQTKQQDNTTQSADTMVIKKDLTDTATNTVSTDTTKR